MRKILIVTMVYVLAIGLSANDLAASARQTLPDMTGHYESYGRELSITHVEGEALARASFEGSVHVDSSQNGYGLISIATNPISVNPYDHNEVTMAYRQYEDGTISGSLGLSYSEDGGAHWTTYHKLNSGLSESGARYPSTLASENYPLVLWNEYGGGGGTYGGRAYYSYDEHLYGGGFWTPGQDVHNKPSESDSWFVIPTQNVDASGNYIVNVVLTDGLAGAGDHLQFRSQTNGTWSGTPLEMSIPNTIVANSTDFRVNSDGSTNTSAGNMDINSQGVGYYAISAYWNNSSTIANHTLFVKKTTDYGATWSGWYTISDQTLDAHFASVFPANNGTFSLPATWTPFVGESLEVLADESGGLHILAPVIPNEGTGYYPTYSKECGIYHFYAASAALSGSTGGVPVAITPEISFVASMQFAYGIESPYWYDSDVISIAYDQANENNLYMVYYAATAGPTGGNYLNSSIDILGAYSLDNGATWSKPQNISNTSNPAVDETHPHLNRFAVDGYIYLMYQVPDYNQATVSGPDSPKDYLNHVYFYRYNAATMVSIDHEPSQSPDGFVLKENYPNPFNPSTVVAFSLPTAGSTELMVYDIRGQVVQILHQGLLNAGDHEFSFQAGDLPSGTYFYRLTSQGFTNTKKMLLLK